MIFGIYCRKSVLSEKGESVENQAEMCRTYIVNKFDGQNELMFYEDDGYSGKNIDRPEFKRMMADIINHKMDYVICYRLDRISRSVSDFSALVEMMNRHKTGLICIKEEFDTSRPMGKAMMYMASVFAQLERETIGERVRDNMIMLSKDGRWLGGTAPLGYHSEKMEFINENGKSKYACYLKEDQTLIVAARVYELYMKYGNISKTVEELNKDGFKTKTASEFSGYSVRGILTNPVYCRADDETFEYFLNNGINVYGCISENGLISYNKSKKDDVVIAVGRHKPVVSGREWIKVQRDLKSRRIYGISKITSGKSLVSGTIKCGLCGGRMISVNRANKVDYDYICENKRKRHECLCKNLCGIQADLHIKKFMDDEGILDKNCNEFEAKKAAREYIDVMWDGKNINIRKTL